MAAKKGRTRLNRRRYGLHGSGHLRRLRGVTLGLEDGGLLEVLGYA